MGLGGHHTPLASVSNLRSSSRPLIGLLVDGRRRSCDFKTQGLFFHPIFLLDAFEFLNLMLYIVVNRLVAQNFKEKNRVDRRVGDV